MAYCIRIALPGEVAQVAERVGELGDVVAGVRQECDCKEKDVLFELDSMQVRLDATASQLKAGCNTSVQEKIE